MKAKKYIINTAFAEVVINFVPTISHEEIINGIIPNMFYVSAEAEFVGMIDLPDDYVEMTSEIISPDEFSARMEEEYGEMCPGIGY